jgi:regulator of protease activity HflC (stomatin/prohibitin superfamily)
MRKITTFVALCAIAGVCGYVATVNLWVALALALALAVLFLWNGIAKVPANPPHKAVLTFCGRRLTVVLNEGWNWVPVRPLLFSLIPIRVEKINKDFPPQRVRTPDKAEISVSASVTFIPGIAGDPESYITYLNSGAEVGVGRILGDTVEDRVKTWAASNKEGPADWPEAQMMRDDAHSVLAHAILGEALTKVGGPIPTSTLLRYFSVPQMEPTAYDSSPRNGWATGGEDWNWNGLDAIFSNFSVETQAELRRRVTQRRQEVKALREGRGSFGIESLGITILRFSVNEVRVEGEVARAAELAEKERREQDADKMEIENISERVKFLMEQHPKLTVEAAIQLVQTERGKVRKTVIDVNGSQTSIGHDLLGLLGAKDLSHGSSGSGDQPDRGGRQDNRQDGQSDQEPPRMKTREELIKEADEFHEKFGTWPGIDPLKRGG